MVDVLNDLGAMVAVLLLVIPDAHLVRRPDVNYSFEQKLTNVSEKLAHQYYESIFGTEFNWPTLCALSSTSAPPAACANHLISVS